MMNSKKFIKMKILLLIFPKMSKIKQTNKIFQINKNIFNIIIIFLYLKMITKIEIAIIHQCLNLLKIKKMKIKKIKIKWKNNKKIIIIK